MQQTIEKFYQCFAHLDAAGMVSCYHKDVVFTDPAFGQLEGEHARNMWRMLCASQQDKDFRIEYTDIRAEGQQGSAHWEAYYTFSQTGRKVHNIIDATFHFQDDKIIRHTDHFDLYRWSRQAIGLPAYLLGWSPFFKNKLQAQTHKLLSTFEATRREER